MELCSFEVLLPFSSDSAPLTMGRRGSNERQQWIGGVSPLCELCHVIGHGRANGLPPLDSAVQSAVLQRAAVELQVSVCGSKPQGTWFVGFLLPLCRLMGKKGDNLHLNEFPGGADVPGSWPHWETSALVGRGWELRLPRFQSWLCSLLAGWPLGRTAAHSRVSCLDSGDNNSTAFVGCLP